VQIGATLRYLMYHDVYGQPDLARELYGKLPEAARSFAHLDFAAARAACPHGVDIPRYMRRAAEVLGGGAETARVG
jgi:predicted aldo/keto reductase-like oxidoreductase